MNSPTAALTWEIWRRHGKRLSAIIFLLLIFALFYPKVCGLLGLNLNNLDEMAAQVGQQVKQAPVWVAVLKVLTVLLLLMGPPACMLLSLLYVVWIFTFAELDLEKGFSFPSRLFTLPVSTNFLVCWFLIGGAAIVTLVSLGWTWLVQQPPIDVFAGYQQPLFWLTLLAAGQAIVWALDAFPVARVLVLSGVVFGIGFLGGPSSREYALLDQNRTLIFLLILAISSGFSFIGLSKIRHGSWQNWTWKWRLGLAAQQSKFKTRRPFQTAARAQFWYEWRSRAGKLFIYVCALSGVPLLLHFVFCMVVQPGNLSEESTFGLMVYLVSVPLFIHFVHGIVPERALPGFLSVRPLTDGEFVMAKYKSAALSAALSWAVTLPMLCAVPMLGDVQAAFEHTPFFGASQQISWGLVAMLVLGLIFLTWRFVAADLWFGFVGSSKLANAPILKTLALFAVAGFCSYLAHAPGLQNKVLRFLPFLLAGLVMLKFALAQWAFRVALQKELLARSAMAKYLAVWSALAASFILPAVVVFHGERWILSLVFGIILVLPLARIGFSPIALSLERHR